MRAAKAVKDLQGICNSLAEQLGKHLAKKVDGSNVDYLSDHVLPLLLSLAGVLCVEQPPDPRAFSACWLANQYTQQLKPGLDGEAPDAGAGPEGGHIHFVVPPSEAAPAKPRPRQPGLQQVEEETSQEGRVPDPAQLDRQPIRESSRELQSTNPKRGQRNRSSRHSAAYVNRMRGSMDMGELLHDDRRCAFMDQDYFGPDGGAGYPSSYVPAQVHTTEEIIHKLREVPQFETLGYTDIERVAKIAITRRFEPDEIIVNFQEPMKSLHVIVEGSGKVTVPQNAGQLAIGDFVGEECLRVPDARSNFNICAGEKGVITITVPQAEFAKLNLVRRIKHKKTPCHKANAFANEGSGSEKRKSQMERRLLEDYKMTEADKEMIKEALMNNKVLSEVVHLTPEQSDMFIDKMSLMRYSAGENVVVKGDTGNNFFIVQEGQLRLPLGKDSHEDFRRGDSFGELALLYNEPRKQTVQATVDCTLWVMEQSDFKAISQFTTKRELEEYVELLRQVPFLVETVDDTLFFQLASVLEEVIFLEDDEVVTKGEDQGMFFLIVSGEVTLEELSIEKIASMQTRRGAVLHDFPAAANPTLRRGQWIGQKELLDNSVAPRTAICTSAESKVMMLEQESYRLLLDATHQLHCSRGRGPEQAGDIFRRQVTRLLRGIRSVACFKVKGDATKGLSMVDCDVVGALGEGGFGTVLLLRDRRDNREYALKALSKNSHEAEPALDALMERRLLTILADSEFIVRLHACFEDSSWTYLVLDCAFGGELFDVFTDNDLWGSNVHCRFCIACVALGLSHMHSKRIVWRDLKLENCLVDLKGYVKLTDMGIAKQIIGKTYTVCGTADYFAPETLRQTGHNRAADWWACGVLLFIMVIGRSPFDAPETPQIYKNIIKGMAKVRFPNTCSQEAQDLICALCQKKPEDRLPMQKGGVSNLMEMPFFNDFSWEDLQSLKMEAPYLPPTPNYERIKAKEAEMARQVVWDPANMKYVNEDVFDQLAPQPGITSAVSASEP